MKNEYNVKYNIKKMNEMALLDSKYRKWHDNIINRAKERELSEKVYFEIHHIVPKCCGGTDKPDNLVKLTAKEHVLIHKLLLEIYPLCPGIALAVIAMSFSKKSGRCGEKYFSNRELAYYREAAARNRRGRKMPDSMGKKIAEANRKRIVTDVQKKKMSNYMKSQKNKREESYLRNISKGHLGQKAWNKGKPMTDEQKKKLSLARQGYKLRKVIDPSGREFRSLKEAGKANGISAKMVKNWIETRPEFGYRFKD